MKSNEVSQSARGTGIGCVAILFLAMFSSHLWASTLSAQSSLLKSIQNLASQDKPADIRVEIKEGTLCQALKVLEKKAHSSYTCPESLNQIKVHPRTIRGSSWQSIATELLSGYNTIVLWSNEEIESIYLLSLPSGAVSGSQAVQAPKKNNELLESISKLRSQWANSPLPDELFNYSGFQDIFKTAGINFPEDWKNQSKQKKAKQELKKLYLKIQQEDKEIKD